MHEMHAVPDGVRLVEETKGWRGWVTGIAPLMLLAHLALEFSFNFLPVTYPYLIPKLRLTYGQIGTAVLAMTVAGTITQPLFGLLSDRSDPRRIVLFSMIWGGLLMGLVGFMPTYGWLVGLMVLAALGSAGFHPPSAALASRVAAGERGRAMSLFSVGGNLGAAISPVVMGVVLAAFGLAGTAIVFPLALLSAFLLAIKLRAHAGMTPSVSRRDTAAVGRSRAGSMAALLAIVGVVAARSYFQQALMTYLPQWLQEDGWTLTAGGAALSAFMIAVSFGSLVGGSLSDRLGRLRVIFASMGLIMVGHWLTLNLSGLPQLAAVVLSGLAIGISFPVTIVLAQEAFPHRIAFASAMVMGLGWLPAGLGAWAVGQISDARGLTAGFTSLLLVPLVSIAAAAAYYFINGSQRVKQDSATP
jgi:FSR family fosmidomycin resistance protein-like MFS transporter